MREIEVYIEVNDRTIANGNLFELIEPVWDRVSIYHGVAEYEAALSGFSIPQRLLFAIRWYRAEVNNGGHDQFFFNSTGIVWPDALDGFEAIGLPRAAAILREAASRLGTESRSRAARQSALDMHQPYFEDLDDAFFKLDRTGMIEEHAIAYAWKHASAFYFRGTVTRTVQYPAI